MSAPLWMPGAIRIPSTRRIGLNNNGFRLLTWHTFECPYSWTVEQALRFLINQATEAFVFHPITGQWGQCQPMNTGARTLRAAGAVTNAFGTVHQQVEVIGYAGRPFTNDLTPAGRAGLAQGMAFFRQWGIPDQWAWTGVDRPPATYAEMLRFRKRAPDRSGHAFHSGWHGGNMHWDPGAIAPPWTIAPPPRPVTPGRDGDVFFEGADGPDVHQWQRDLAALGYDLVGVGLFGPKTTAATRAFQSDHGITVDGRVGPETRTTMETAMSNLADLAAQVTRLERKIDTQSGILTRLVDGVSKIPGAVWGHRLYSFAAHWWLRRGAVDPGHRNSPADPGSPADHELRSRVDDDGLVDVYTQDGPVTFRLDPTTDRFTIVETQED